MSTRGNKKRTEFLGMSFGTARARLQRKILFDLVQKAGEDTCFRCDEKIVEVEDLSIEHKKNWLDVDPELFWDLQNVAFSHQKCNSGNHRNRILCSTSESWCYVCKTMLPIDNFWIAKIGAKRASTGLKLECKSCKNTRQNEYRRKKRQEHA
jgi:hypothetical protein